MVMNICTHPKVRFNVGERGGWITSDRQYAESTWYGIGKQV